MGAIGPDRTALYRVLELVRNSRETTFAEIAAAMRRQFRSRIDESRAMNDLFLLSQNGLVVASSPPQNLVGNQILDKDGNVVTFRKTPLGVRTLFEANRRKKAQTGNTGATSASNSG
jgi:hypothetical protein